MLYALLLVFVSLFSSLQAAPLKELHVHYMWGLWDTTPLPKSYKLAQVKNAKALKATSSTTHEKEEILFFVQKFSEEYDPEFLTLFCQIPRKVSQADLGRYVLIYYLGGLYLDLDVDVKEGALLHANLNHPNGTFVTERIAKVSQLGPREKPYAKRIAQYAFYLPEPGSPLLLEIIQQSIERVKTLFAEGNPWSDQDVLFATGPDVVTSVLHETSLKGFKILDLDRSRRLFLHKREGTWRDSQDQ